MRRCVFALIALSLAPAESNAQVARRIYGLDEPSFAAALASAPKSSRRETTTWSMNIVIADGGQILAKQGTSWPMGQIVTIHARRYTLLFFEDGEPVWLLEFFDYDGRVGAGFDPYSESMYATWTQEGDVRYRTDIYGGDIDEYEEFWPISTLGW